MPIHRSAPLSDCNMIRQTCTVYCRPCACIDSHAHTQVCTAFALAERQVTKATSLVTKFQPGVGVGSIVDRLCTTGRATVVTDAERQRVLALLVPGRAAEGDSEVDLPHLAVTHAHLICIC